jgi:hypothetical protein
MSFQENRKLNYLYDLDGIMDEDMKQNIHVKVESYTKRVEEIRCNLENEVSENKPLSDDTTDCESLKGEQTNKDTMENNDKNYCMRLVKSRLYDAHKYLQKY